MHSFFYLYKRLMDYLNIMQIVIKIKTQNNFNELVFFIPTTNTTLTISNIMVLIYSFINKMILINHLRKLLLVYMKNHEKNIIKTFNLILKPNKKEKYLEDFYNNNTKI